MITLVYAILNEGWLILSQLSTLFTVDHHQIIKTDVFFVFFNQKQLKVTVPLGQDETINFFDNGIRIWELSLRPFIEPMLDVWPVCFIKYCFFFRFYIFFRVWSINQNFFFEFMGGDQCISLSYSPSHSYYAAPIFCIKHFFLDQVYFHWNLIIFYFHFIDRKSVV